MQKLLAVLLFALFGCQATAPLPQDGHLYPAAHGIRVTHAPRADFGAADTETVLLADAADLRRWRATLSAVPETPEKGVRMIQFLPETEEFRVEFLGPDGAVLGSHRIKGTCLDVASHPGWAFYAGEDAAFVALVRDLFART